jgi:hypothetical protein
MLSVFSKTSKYNKKDICSEVINQNKLRFFIPDKNQVIAQKMFVEYHFTISLKVDHSFNRENLQQSLNHLLQLSGLCAGFPQIELRKYGLMNSSRLDFSTDGRYLSLNPGKYARIIGDRYKYICPNIDAIKNNNMIKKRGLADLLKLTPISNLGNVELVGEWLCVNKYAFRISDTKITEIRLIEEVEPQSSDNLPIELPINAIEPLLFPSDPGAQYGYNIKCNCIVTLHPDNLETLLVDNKGNSTLSIKIINSKLHYSILDTKLVMCNLMYAIEHQERYIAYHPIHREQFRFRKLNSLMYVWINSSQELSAIKLVSITISSGGYSKVLLESDLDNSGNHEYKVVDFSALKIDPTYTDFIITIEINMQDLGKDQYIFNAAIYSVEESV